jgi:hypothetical protein
MRLYSPILFVLLFYLAAASLSAQNLNLLPVKDNTIFSEADSSNGAGIYLFSGKTSVGSERRALLKFDFSELQSGDSITSVELQLYLSRTISDDQTITLNRLTTDWGEGSSNATGEEGGGATAQTGDATWNYAFFNTFSWNAAGGDYSAIPSAEAAAGRTGFYTWSGPGLIKDIKDWIANPDSNYGWIIINQGGNKSAKRFNSRENDADRPLLNIQYLVTSTQTRASQNDFIIYPNPTRGLIHIKGLLSDERMQIRIFDACGRELELKKKMVSTGTGPIQLELPEKGIYFITIDSESFRKVIVL